MSGSVTQAFEMIIQQQITQHLQDAPDADQAHPGRIVAEGWTSAMRLIQAMGANTRYFTDSSPKIPLDVGDGDSAVGMSIDFYGRFQGESTRDPSTGRERMHYFKPAPWHEHQRRSYRDVAWARLTGKWRSRSWNT